MKIRFVNKKIIDILIALAGVLAVSFVLTSFWDFYYDINDDMMIKDIISGRYTGTPDGHNIQMLYPIGLIISFFYRIAPQFPWYAYFLCLLMALCFFMVWKRLVSVTHKFWKKILFLLVGIFLYTALFLWESIYIQYTVISGLLMATAVFWFLTTEHGLTPAKFLKENIISVVLVFFAYGIRSEMALILTPLLCFVGLFHWYDEAKLMMISNNETKVRKHTRMYFFFSQTNLIKYVSLVFVAVFSVFLMLFADKLAYNSKEYRTFIKLFDSRTEVYDYLKLPEYENNDEIYETIGLAEEELALLENYNYMLDPKIDQELFERLEIILTDGGRKYYALSLEEGIKQYAYRLTHGEDAPYIYYVWILYAVMAFSALIVKNSTYFWKLPILFAVRSALWMFLIMRGRMPDRVITPMYIMEIFILLAMILSEIGKLKSSDKAHYKRFWPVMVASVLVIVGARACYDNVRETFNENERREEKNSEWLALEKYMGENPENLYLLDVYSTVAYSEKMYGDTDNSLMNYTIAGGWVCKSPLEAEKLAHYGVDNVESDLINRENVYFVAYTSKDMQWLKNYYAIKGIYVKLVPVHEIPFKNGDGFTVYFVRNLAVTKMNEIFQLFKEGPIFGVTESEGNLQ